MLTRTISFCRAARYGSGSGPVRAVFTKRSDSDSSASVADPNSPCFSVVDGRLLVPDSCRSGPHPIAWLIERAERDWQVKQKKQSKTLRQADREYRRRYGRPPPKGFGDWWKYVK